MGYVVGILLVALLFWAICRSVSKTQRATGVLKEHVKYDMLEEVLTVHKRAKVLSEFFSITEDRNASVTHTPDKLVYTGATVGGVTTGGFHVEQGNTVVHLGSKNGKYYIWLKYAFPDANSLSGWTGAGVHQVKLTSEDFKRAREMFPHLSVARDKYTGKEKTNTLEIPFTTDTSKLQAFINWLCSDD